MCETENNQQNLISTCTVHDEDKESIKAGTGMLSAGDSLKVETEDEETNCGNMIRNMQLSLNCVVHDGYADEDIYVEVVGVKVKKKNVSHYPEVTVKTKTILLRIKTRIKRTKHLTSHLMSQCSLE
jgi:ribosomal protein L32